MFMQFNQSIQLSACGAGLWQVRERTDLGTDSDSAPISLDRNRIRPNIRSVIDPSAILSALSITSSNAAEAIQLQAAQSSDRTMPRL